MSERNELDYQLYLIKSVLADCIDELDMPKNRTAFLLYYDISAEDAHEIDKMFAEMSLNDEMISFVDFQEKLNEGLSQPLAEKVVKEMLQAYKEYVPVAIGKIKL
ncbi:hypothetical protein lacNasYZ03_17480 [Lactobacillus nasalidis]|uniref:DUF1878 family protein n=1 Tax=Lactobacillus nasalidis TaxID=2797258 RepID=A0ABQ3W968_9LACO|nr:hypothetical protein [Lactobacillus nasalidis]GHV97428.1 hypothetical protein lacNasYZ01_06100 [Lactobacillus nasalidis]GHV99041.1 hypothetical protein lacNasYZ02_04710 [Lactobacillus nasalidis]GHW02061.1 hypothetical protein lacNasYZ03_17480 [Lactobacillus nasalidis]